MILPSSQLSLFWSSSTNGVCTSVWFRCACSVSVISPLHVSNRPLYKVWSKSRSFEVQMKEINHINCMYRGFVFCVCGRPHLSVFNQPPSPKHAHPSAILASFYQPPTTNSPQWRSHKWITPIKKTKFSIKYGKHSILKNDDILYNVIASIIEKTFWLKNQTSFSYYILLYTLVCANCNLLFYLSLGHIITTGTTSIAPATWRIKYPVNALSQKNSPWGDL